MLVALNVVLSMPVAMDCAGDDMRPPRVNDIAMRGADDVAVRVSHDVVVMVNVSADDSAVKM